ncbi:MAG: nucleotide exchange factor GrpE [Limnochordia bacterium]
MPHEEEQKQEVTVEDELVEGEEVSETQNLQERIEELEGNYLRLRADFENFRRRTRQEKESLGDTVAATIMADLLPIIDDLERALAAEATDEALHTGVQMVYRRLMQTLEQKGLQPIDAVGQPFDPNLHEAVSTDGTGEMVLEEFRRGYLFKERLLRPSMVRVGSQGEQAREGDEE